MNMANKGDGAKGNGHGHLLDACSKAIREALRLGASGAEAYASRNRQITAYMESNALKHVKVGEPIGIGVRVVVDGASGFASINSIDDVSIESVVDGALSMARACPRDRHNRLPEPKGRAPALNIYDEGVEGMTVEDVAMYARSMLRYAVEDDARVTVDSGLFDSSSIEHAVCNTNGIEAYERISIITWSIMGMARDGSMVSNFDVQMGSSHHIKGIDVVTTAREFARSVLGSLNSRKGESFKGTMIITPNAFLELVKEPVAFAINAFNVQRRASRFARMLGKRVASDLVTIIDDATYAEGTGASSFDREGVAHRRSVIVDKGVLRGFIHNTYTASRAGVESTGNASGGIASPPSIDTTNMVVEAGEMSYGEICREVRRGVIINRFSGNVSAVDGAFSGVVKGGHMIVDGEIAYPVREVMVAGNIYDALRSVSMVSKERRLVMDSLIPWIAVEGVSFTAG
ncbi:MAG: TldD/PmbA family protein [Candidatus Nitrosocaldus sp.]|nr:TldD/PmbA family protein [Candidatus Nitrosocaldus sp.]